jgi:ribosomal protein S18 acetylase RimI-like enzyme
MPTTLTLRDYASQDADAVNAVARAAWQQFQPAFKIDWDGFINYAVNTAALADELDLIVAESEGKLIGVIGYVRPQRAREAVFPPEWAVIRMLSVHPEARGQGAGRALTQECIARARRDGASIIGLHTGPLFGTALDMYLRMGFTFQRALPERRGNPVNLYAMKIAQERK